MTGRIVPVHAPEKYSRIASLPKRGFGVLGETNSTSFTYRPTRRSSSHLLKSSAMRGTTVSGLLCVSPPRRCCAQPARTPANRANTSDVRMVPPVLPNLLSGAARCRISWALRPIQARLDAGKCPPGNGQVEVQGWKFTHIKIDKSIKGRHVHGVPAHLRGACTQWQGRAVEFARNSIARRRVPLYKPCPHHPHHHHRRRIRPQHPRPQLHRPPSCRPRLCLFFFRESPLRPTQKTQ